MAKCNCGGQVCGCRIEAGAGIAVEGAGSARDPYVISAESEGGGGAGGFIAGDIKDTVRTDTPAGWVDCNGQTLSRTGFAALFTAIGTRWGAGDGFSTFNVPNFGGKFRLGAGVGYALGASGGADTTSLTVGNLPGHTHVVPTHSHGLGNHTHSDAHDHGITTTESALHTHPISYRVDTADNTKTESGGAKRVTDVKVGTGGLTGSTGGQPERHTHTVPAWNGRTDGPFPGTSDAVAASTTSSTGGGQSFTNMPPYRAVRVLIKT